MSRVPMSYETAQFRILGWAFGLNAAMFVIEAGAGWWFHSSALLADALDMFADAAVYGVSLYAVGRSARMKAQAAALHAVSHLLLALLLVTESVRVSIQGQLPHSTVMAVLSVAALAVNAGCVLLLHQFRCDDVNLRASWLCSRNDLLGNVGVLLASVLVAVLDSAWPDRIVGLVLAVVMLRSAGHIWRDSQRQLRGMANPLGQLAS